jgi:hypothetical protein
MSSGLVSPYLSEEFYFSITHLTWDVKLYLYSRGLHGAEEAPPVSLPGSVNTESFFFFDAVKLARRVPFSKGPEV